MIKCNRCGSMTPAGAICQSCGAPLSNKVDNGFSPSMGYQEQPELPAWLESLRAGERPAAPADNPTSFSPADLIEEGSLPDWMRAERNERDNTSANPAIQRPSAYPEQPAANGDFVPQSFTANSLIDEKSLPPWMQEERSSNPPSSPGGLAASSLVQPSNLPEWMKTLQPPSAPSAPAANPAPVQRVTRVQPVQQPAPPAAIPGSPTGGPAFSAHDLIDPQSLPSWMQSPAENTGRPPQSPLAQQGFPASAETYDASAQGAQGNWRNDARSTVPPTPAPSAYPEYPPTAQGGQAGLAASSLLDMNALPPWLREGGLQGSNSNNSNMGAMAPQAAPGGSPFAPVQTPAGQPDNGRVAASSFIDMNSLPNWLRSNDEPQGNPMVQPRTGSGISGISGIYNGYNVPGSSPRADNMRVPSRPRGEVNQTETSELAANVFASMLGVASSTPNFPGQQSPSASSPQQPAGQGNYQQQPAQVSPYGQPPAAYGQMSQAGQPDLSGQSYGASPYSQMNQGNPGSQTNIPNPMGNAFGSQTSIPNPAAAPNTPASFGGGYSPGYANNTPAGYSGMYGNANQDQGNASSLNGMSNNNSMSSPYGSSAGSSYSSAASQSSSASDDQKNKKRGIFEAIRDWLSR